MIDLSRSKVYVDVPIPGTEEQMTLIVRRPTWSEADKMGRRINEHWLRMQAMRDTWYPPEVTEEADRDKYRMSLEEELRSTSELNQLQDSLEAYKRSDVQNFIQGFVDVDESGEPIFEDDHGPLLMDSRDWRERLMDLLGPVLSSVWDQLRKDSRPPETELKFRGQLAKNSVPASIS